MLKETSTDVILALRMLMEKNREGQRGAVVLMRSSGGAEGCQRSRTWMRAGGQWRGDVGVTEESKYIKCNKCLS